MGRNDAISLQKRQADMLYTVALYERDNSYARELLYW